jgi:hypothetical protein
MRAAAVRPARSQTLFAFLDESHTASSDEGPGAYTMAAAALSDLSLDRCRAVMESLRLGGSQKLHWREESRGRRRLIIEAVASLRVRHIVVTRPANVRERQERQRRLCLTRLLFELNSLGTTSVTLESRGGADNNRDRRLLDALRAQRLIGSDVRIDHLPGPSESLLWIPDAVCGAIHAAHRGDGEHWRALSADNSVQLIGMEG